MTIALEHVVENDWTALQRIVDTLRVTVLDTGGQSAGVRFGSGSGTWPGGSPRANTTTVTHGLGTTPVAVFAVTHTGVGASTTVFPVVAAFSPGATSFSVSAVTSDGSSPAAATAYSFYWLAVG